MNYPTAGIIGAGRSGIAAARLLHRLGCRVLLSDSSRVSSKFPRGIHLEQNGHSAKLLDQDLIIRSPGVPNHLPVLKKARALGRPIWSELELASRFIHPQAIIAITGTNGKTTTTTLVGKIWKAAGRPAWVGGNLGAPLAEGVSRITPRTTVVLEVSSYQLENIETFHPQLTALLNITPDHLEHHGTLRAYAKAKARIFQNQTWKDVMVFNADDDRCRSLARQCPARVMGFSRKRVLSSGVYYRHGAVHIRWRRRRESWPLRTSLPGPHNIENILAAIGLAVAGGISSSVLKRVLRQFRGVEHRLEYVRTLSRVRYINDSKGTNVDSTRVALASFAGPITLIMGGQGKGSSYAPLKPWLKKRVKRILLIGGDASRIRRDLAKTVPFSDCRTLNKAVRESFARAQPGELVLFSPACASFDQYENYEERGQHFKALVRALP